MRSLHRRRRQWRTCLSVAVSAGEKPGIPRISGSENLEAAEKDLLGVYQSR
jgi:hypothetical protein